MTIKKKMVVISIVAIAATYVFVGIAIRYVSNQQVTTLNDELRSTKAVAAILDSIEKTQNKINTPLKYAEKQSSFKSNKYMGFLELDMDYAMRPEVQSTLKECTAVTLDDDVSKSLKSIRQSSVTLSGDYKKYVDLWIQEAEDAASGTCYLNWYRLDDSKYENALKSKVTIDEIVGLKKLADDRINNLTSQISNLNSKKLLVF